MTGEAGKSKKRYSGKGAGYRKPRKVNVNYLAFISKNAPGFTPEKIETFLEQLRWGKSVFSAAKAAGVSRQTAFLEKDANPEFAKAWNDAYEAGTDYLEDVALQRAEQKSDTLLIVTLKARRPDKYIEKRALEVNQHVNITVQKAREELKGITKEQLQEAQRLLMAPVVENEIAEQENAASDDTGGMDDGEEL